MPGSNQYQDFDGYLLGQSVFAELRKSDDLPVAAEAHRAKYLAQRTELLHARLDEVQRLIKRGKLDDIKIKKEGFSIKPYRGAAIPDEVKVFTAQVYAELPRIKITDLLVEVGNRQALPTVILETDAHASLIEKMAFQNFIC